MPAAATPAPEAAPPAMASASAAAPAVAAPPAPTPVPPAPAAAPATHSKPALDSEIIEDLWSAMGDQFTQLVDVFLEDAPNHLTKLEAAAAKGDIGGLAGPAHALKSSSANLGAMELSAAAKYIEHGSRDKSLTDAVEAVRRLQNEFRRAEVELRVLLH
jgi:HPt (histidine-containing phosphotransfer) domain-containing protein